MSRITLTALLLTGGLSRRMGTDKATLLVNGEPLWSRQLRTLRELKPATLAVSARTRPSWCPSDAAVILDGDTSRGPLSGLAAALASLQTTHLLALAVDLPRMTSEHLKTLCALGRPGCGVVPVRGNRFEPLCAVYPVEASPQAVAALNSDDASLQSFIRTLETAGQTQPFSVATVDDPLYHNLNTPTDLG